MRLEKKRQEQMGKRKGLAGRTVIFVIWLLFSFAIAYFLTEYLFSEGYLTEKIYYTDLRIPNSVPLNGLKFGTMFVIVVVMQMVFTLGFMVASPEGRRRTGEATLYSRNKDPFDDGRY